MLTHTNSLGRKWRLAKLGFHLTVSAVVIALSLMLLIYPAVTICMVVTDSKLRQTGQCRLVPAWFNSAAGRFRSWANMYLETNYAGSLYHDDIPATEWPMFGSVFFLVTAEDLQSQGKIDATQRNRPRGRREGRRNRRLAGDGHLGEDQMGRRLSGEGERLLPDAADPGAVVLRENHGQHAVSCVDVPAAGDAGGRIGQGQAAPPRRLSRRVLSGRHALGRGGHSAGGTARWGQPRRLAKSLMAAFDGPLKAPEGLPAFQADSRSGRIIQGARGCGNSGILLFAAELDPVVAGRWYDDYEKGFWKDTGWIAGFTEMPRESHERLHGRRFRAGAVPGRLRGVGLRHRRGQDGRTDRPRGPADDGGGGLLLADALRLPASRRHGPRWRSRVGVWARSPCCSR